MLHIPFFFLITPSPAVTETIPLSIPPPLFFSLFLSLSVSPSLKFIKHSFSFGFPFRLLKMRLLPIKLLLDAEQPHSPGAAIGMIYKLTGVTSSPQLAFNQTLAAEFTLV